MRCPLQCLAAFVLTFMGFSGLWTAGVAEEAPYDLVIRQSKIVESTGNPWYYGDLAARGSQIVALGRVPALPAKREIRASGLIVAPGFIDMHSHSDFTLLEDGNA